MNWHKINATATRKPIHKTEIYHIILKPTWVTTDLSGLYLSFWEEGRREFWQAARLNRFLKLTSDVILAWTRNSLLGNRKWNLQYIKGEIYRDAFKWFANITFRVAVSIRKTGEKLRKWKKQRIGCKDRVSEIALSCISYEWWALTGKEMRPKYQEDRTEKEQRKKMQLMMSNLWIHTGKSPFLSLLSN